MNWPKIAPSAKTSSRALRQGTASRRERRRLTSEARILDAAEQVFAETGFSGATTADIAATARLPKANVHYYFGTKERLYRRVLERILDAWLASGDSIQADADPAAALRDYIAAKMRASQHQPFASKVFANEILHGAPQLADYLANQVRRWVEGKAKIIDRWVARGLMRPVDVPHLFFVIWSSTQTYADFESQIRAVLKRDRMRAEDYARGGELITRMVLGACGIVDKSARSSARRSRPRAIGRT